MNKRQTKIELVRKYIKNINVNGVAYTYLNIPKDIANNAISSYASSVRYKDIIGIIDTSKTGNGKKGLLFTEYKVFYNNGMMRKKGSISYNLIYENRGVPAEIINPDYNKQNLVELLNELSVIESDSVQNQIRKIGAAFDDINHEAKEFTETLESGLNLIKSVFDLFDNNSSK